MSASTFKKVSAAAVTAALALAGLSVANAAPINIYNTGFEASAQTGYTPFPDTPAVGYTINPLSGQNTWSDADGGSNVVNVISSAGVPGVGANQGRQVVKMIANGGGFVDYFNSSLANTGAGALPASNFGGNVVDVSFDLSRAGGAGKSAGFGVEILSKNQDQVLGSIFLGNNVTDSTPSLLVAKDGDGNVPNTNAGFAPGYDGTWGTYHIRLDFNTHQFFVFADGNAIGSGPYAMNALGVAEGDSIGGITLASTNEGTDTAYFDNLKVVPEPAGIAMVGLGSMLLLAKRPKRSA